MIAATAVVITLVISIVISACYKATSIEIKNIRASEMEKVKSENE